MKKAFKKYFIVSLSLLLILSNFSFATQLMICEMTGDSHKCECSKINHTSYPGVNLTKEKSKCCDEKITELSNTNTLLNYNINQENDLIFSDLYFNSTINYFQFTETEFLISKDKSYLPGIDIPVYTSSLLI